MFVNYSGKKPQLVDPHTGEVIEAELFVAVLGDSSYAYAEARTRRKSPTAIGRHVRAFAFCGGVARAYVPDNLKSGVTHARFYEPTVQSSYEHMADHYGTAILPAHKGKPKHKAKVEVGVQVVQRWVLARLRNRVFYTLAALNEAIPQCLRELNERQMRECGVKQDAALSDVDVKSIAKRVQSRPATSPSAERERLLPHHRLPQQAKLPT